MSDDDRPETAPPPCRTRVLTLAFLVYATLGLSFRIALVALSRDVGVGAGVAAVLVGLLSDAVLLAYATLPAVLWVTLAPDRIWRHPWHRRAAFVVWSVAVYLLVFEIASEWFFWDEFSSRFNFVAVDYLVYTREVLGNVVESYPVAWIALGLLVPAATIVALTRTQLSRALSARTTLRERLRTGLVWFAPFLASATFASHDWAEFSDNHIANEIAANGPESLVFAYASNHLDYARFYATIDPAEVNARLRRRTAGTGAGDGTQAAVDSVEHAVTRQITGTGPERRMNVVLVCVESLSARFVGAYGAKDKRAGITPRLDSYAERSLVFTRLYATGTRTVRGLEALSISVPPTPGRSVVKRPGATGLFSLGSVLRDHGYTTRFVYGGYGYFDNMNAFFAGNGFDVTDRTDLADDEVTFANVWGVCDEDLFARTLRECDADFASGRPFLSFVMTTSNHRPFTYPDGRIDIPSGDGRNGSVKYTDHAIGRFLDEAATHPWFADTLFVIVADHCASSRGRTDIPVDRFHIPMLVYAPGVVQPGTFDGLCSQIDVAPMICGLLNLSYESRFFGVDPLRTPPERALMGNYLYVGLLEGDRLVTLGPKKTIACEQVRGVDDQVPATADPELVNDAISYYQGADALLSRALDRGDSE